MRDLMEELKKPMNQIQVGLLALSIHTTCNAGQLPNIPRFQGVPPPSNLETHQQAICLQSKLFNSLSLQA